MIRATGGVLRAGRLDASVVRDSRPRRHGRTELNERGLLQGRLDAPLDELGQHQVARVAARLGRVDRVITSPLRRAVETAERLCAEPIVDPRWIELDYGSLDGMAIADVPLSTWVQWRTDPTFTPPGGEPLTALYEGWCRRARNLREAADRDSGREPCVPDQAAMSGRRCGVDLAADALVGVTIIPSRHAYGRFSARSTRRRTDRVTARERAWGSAPLSRDGAAPTFHRPVVRKAVRRR